MLNPTNLPTLYCAATLLRLAHSVENRNALPVPRDSTISIMMGLDILLRALIKWRDVPIARLRVGIYILGVGRPM